LIGAPDRLERIRDAIPVYSVNVAAVVALQAALEDRAHLADYLRQVSESKALLYAACERMQLPYWRSAANFVLVSVGDRADDLVRIAAERGVYVRNRSTEPGCSGCIRIATGIVEHTKQFIGIMEEVLCAAR
jgi:histidinol-phosphate aminotransferase